MGANAHYSSTVNSGEAMSGCRLSWPPFVSPMLGAYEERSSCCGANDGSQGAWGRSTALPGGNNLERCGPGSELPGYDRAPFRANTIIRLCGRIQ